MRSLSDLPELDQLVRRLPFPLDAMDEVGEMFERWHRDPNEGDGFLISLWTYCYVRRYFLVRFARERTFTGGDLEELVDLAYRRIEERKGDLRFPNRYARWVVVICRNTYVSFVSRRRAGVPLHLIAEPAAESDAVESWHEGAGLQSAVASALDRLPSFLRHFVAMKFLQGLDYETISAKTGKDVATVRTYTHRAIGYLKKDRKLMRWIHESSGYESGLDESMGQ